MSIMSFYISFKVKHQDRKTHQSGRSICLTTYAITHTWILLYNSTFVLISFI